MASSADISALLKERYPDEAFNAVFENNILQRACKMQMGKLVGKQFVNPVRLTAESGFTYTQLASGGITLQPAGPAVTKDAVINPSQIYLLSQIDYTSISRAPASGAQSVEGGEDWTLKGSLISLRRRVETNLTHGGTPLATLTTAGAVATVTGGFTLTVTVTTGQWASGFWMAGENSALNAFQANGTPINTNGPLVLQSANSLLRQLVLFQPTAATNADLTALRTYVLANADAAQLWYNTAFDGTNIVESLGLAAIAGNTGTLFTIPPQYNMFQGNNFTVGGALTKDAIDSAISLAVDKGLDSPGILLVSHRSWPSLSAELASVRRMDSSYLKSKGMVGQVSISVASQNGELDIVPSQFIKEGNAAFFSPLETSRIGSRDVKLGLPSLDEVVYAVPGTNYCQAGLMTDQGLFTETPAHMVWMSGIVNANGF